MSPPPAISPEDFLPGANARQSVRAPSVAEGGANQLRDRILSGELQDGAAVAPLDDLMVEFGASKPSIRQGLQILEAEGLLRVRRGRSGGAVVHRPRAYNAAYAMELVLRWGNVPSDDMTEALRQMEPLCAG